MTTKVIFRKFKDGGDIIAFFPTLPGTNDPMNCLSYQHTGQHGAADIDYATYTIPAEPEEYKGLLNELVNMVGYDDLQIVKRSSYKDYLDRCDQIREH